MSVSKVNFYTDGSETKGRPISSWYFWWQTSDVCRFSGGAVVGLLIRAQHSELRCLDSNCGKCLDCNTRRRRAGSGRGRVKLLCMFSLQILSASSLLHPSLLPSSSRLAPSPERAGRRNRFSPPTSSWSSGVFVLHFLKRSENSSTRGNRQQNPTLSASLCFLSAVCELRDLDLSSKRLRVTSFCFTANIYWLTSVCLISNEPFPK